MALVQDIVNKVKSQLSTPTTPSGFVPSSPSPAPEVPASTSNALSEAISSGVTQGVSSVSNGVATAMEPVVTQPVASTPYVARSVGTDSLSSTAPVGLASSPGYSMETSPIVAKDVFRAIPKEVLSPLGIDVDRQAGLDVWEQQAAERESRAPRTSNLFDEQYDMEGSDYGWFDNQLNQVGNTPMNDAYLRAAVDDGLSMDDAWAILHKPDSIDAEREMRSTRKVSPGIYDNVGKVIDDGTSHDYAHMTSDKMTGAQYLKYAEMGMGGRPVEQIVPSEVYSKRREANDYGYIPFTPDTATLLNQSVGNVLELPGRLGSMVSNLRENVTPDYSISYGKDQRNTISGRDFDKLSRPYLEQFYWNRQFAPTRFLSDDGKSTAHVKENVIPDASGRDTYHYGHLTSVDENEDGTFSLGFSDGSNVDISRDYFDTVYDERSNSLTLPPGRSIPAAQAKGKLPDDLASMNDVDDLVAQAEQNGGSPFDYADVVFVPDMVLSDGTRMTLDDVQRLYYDQTPGDDDENDTDDDIEYGFQNTLGGLLEPLSGIPTFFDNRPRRLVEQEPFSIGSDGNIKVSGDMGDNAIDWTLGSLPISVGRMMPWLYSASNGTVSLTGADPATYDPVSDSYRMIAGNYDDKGNMVYGVSNARGERDDQLSEETKWWNAAGNMAIPLTEQIVGPIGNQIVPLERIFGELPANPTLRQLLTNELIGAIGEGVEEDLGNVFEDWTQYGLRGMFANPVVDENGNQVYDQAFHELRDYDTPMADRLRNALNPMDLANSFAGGVTVDALMQAPFLAPEIRPALQRSRALSRTGVRQFVDPEERERQELAESYLEGFNDLYDDERMSANA